MCTRSKHNGHETEVYHIDEKLKSIIDNAIVLCVICYENAVAQGTLKSKEFFAKGQMMFPPIVKVVAQTNANYTCQCVGCDDCLGI